MAADACDAAGGSHAGGCLCGAVRFTARGHLRPVIYCHCRSCRRQSGHVFACTGVADADLTIEGGDSVSWFAATPAARRGFCARCGSMLFWKPEGEARTSIHAGALDDSRGLAASHHIFVAEKGDYYAITDGLPQFAGDD